MNYKIYIVAIELGTKKALEKFEKYSIGFSTPKKIIEGVYAFKTPVAFDSSMLRNNISGYMGEDVPLFITKSSFDAAWRVSEDINNWLKENL